MFSRSYRFAGASFSVTCAHRLDGTPRPEGPACSSLSTHVPWRYTNSQYSSRSRILGTYISADLMLANVAERNISHHSASMTISISMLVLNVLLCEQLHTLSHAFETNEPVSDLHLQRARPHQIANPWAARAPGYACRGCGRLVYHDLGALVPLLHDITLDTHVMGQFLCPRSPPTQFPFTGHLAFTYKTSRVVHKRSSFSGAAARSSSSASSSLPSAPEMLLTPSRQKRRRFLELAHLLNA